MSQFSYQGQDIYPTGDIPADALEIPVKKNWVIKKAEEFFGKHPLALKLYIFGSILLILAGIAIIILVSLNTLVHAIIDSFTIQLTTELGLQTMTITLLTLFIYVLTTAIINIGLAALKLFSYRKMSNKEFFKILGDMQLRGAIFFAWSFVAAIAITWIPALLSQPDFSFQSETVKEIRVGAIIVILVIEKYLESSLTKKIV